MDSDIVAFGQRIHAEVHEAVSEGITEGGNVYSENVFTENIIDFLSEIGMVENPMVCHFEGVAGRGKIKINGYAINDDEDRLDLFASIYIDSATPSSVHKDDIVIAAKRAVRFFSSACKGVHETLEPASEAFGLAKRVHTIAGKIGQLNVFVLTNGTVAVKKIKPTDLNGVSVNLEVMDIERLFRAMQAGLPREEITIDFNKRFSSDIPCLQMPCDFEDYKAYLAIIPGEILYKLYDEFGPRLLELNVRSFLSAKGDINRGIRASLKSEPERFLAYNNGIVVTVDEIKTVTLADGTQAVREVKGLQIVNGGQTTASIHRARKYDQVDLSRVFVPAKITVIRPEIEGVMVQMISKYANSQNGIQQADFSANDPFHVKIEEFSNTIWCPDGHSRWFYERARGSYQVALTREGPTPAKKRKFKEQVPSTQKFTKTDLARYIQAWDQKPHFVSFGNQKNFNFFMQDLRKGRGPNWLPDASYYRSLISKAILYRSVQTIVRREKFPANQANIVTYLISYLAWKTGGNIDHEGIWLTQKISDSLLELIKQWSHIIDDFLRVSAGGRQVSEWAKKSECWDQIKVIEFPLPNPLPQEIKSGTVVVENTLPGIQDMTVEDFRNIDACRALDGDAWLRIFAWGKETGQLKWKEAGIAHTLSGYAATGWQNKLSKKQAWHGMKILELAHQAGVIDLST